MTQKSKGPVSRSEAERRALMERLREKELEDLDESKLSRDELRALEAGVGEADTQNGRPKKVKKWVLLH